MTAVPRLLPMVGDSMEPTLRTGDLVAVLPGSGWNVDGLYVIEQLGQPVVVRATSDHRGGVHMSYDNTRYSAWHLSRADFAASLLGGVFAVCRVVDHALARQAGMQPGQMLIG